MSDDIRAGFERWFSDDWKYPKAVEKTANGYYRLAQANTSWNAWREACEFRDAQYCTPAPDVLQPSPLEQKPNEQKPLDPAVMLETLQRDEFTQRDTL